MSVVALHRYVSDVELMGAYRMMSVLTYLCVIVVVRGQ